jgi:hypothetical protein
LPFIQNVGHILIATDKSIIEGEKHSIFLSPRAEPVDVMHGRHYLPDRQYVISKVLPPEAVQRRSVAS